MCCRVEVINDTKTVKARKEYRDSCRDWIMESLPYMRRDKESYPLTFKQWRLIAESIRDGWKIRKGELHEVQVNKMDGHIYSFRSKPGLSDICQKFDLFGDC
jgi:hypothetical protein